MSDDLARAVAAAIAMSPVDEGYPGRSWAEIAEQAVAVVRERLARDIAALRLPVALGRWEDGTERVDSRAAAHNSGIEQALAVVRGVGEAKP